MAAHYSAAVLPGRVRKPKDYPVDSVIPSRDPEVLVGAGFGGSSSG